MYQIITWLNESITPQNIVFAVAWIIVAAILSRPIKKGLQYLRTPKIRFTPDEHNPTTIVFFKIWPMVNDKGTKNHVLRLIVKNVCWENWTIGKIIPKCKWTRTRKAEKCHFFVTFFDQAGKTVCQEPMLARISVPCDADSPVKKLPLSYHYLDIYPNQEFYVDLVIKLEGSSECYGLWHLLDYSCKKSVTDPDVLTVRWDASWRTTDELWRLESGIYKIMIEAHTVHRQMLKRDYFQLVNLDNQFKVEKIPKFKHVN
jgi:hypothetical protein